MLTRRNFLLGTTALAAAAVLPVISLFTKAKSKTARAVLPDIKGDFYRLTIRGIGDDGKPVVETSLLRRKEAERILRLQGAVVKGRSPGWRFFGLTKMSSVEITAPMFPIVEYKTISVRTL